MAYKTREQNEREAAKEAGRLAGAREERDRLRPLLERALAFAEAAERADGPWVSLNMDRALFLVDVRRELGKDAQPAVPEGKRYVAVSGGGRHCPDGETHRPIPHSDGLHCWRCDALIRELGKET